MKKIILKSIVVIGLLAMSSMAFAKVKPASIFTDHMVLQQQSNVAIWGWAKPLSTVKITTSWNKKLYTASADATGKFKIKVATPKAGGPFEISLNDGELLVLKDILIGEVWFCGGQSNMEMPLKGFKNQPILGANETILKSKNPNIRIYTVPRSSITIRQENSKPSDWKVAGPEAVSNFSATAYYFGSLLSEMLGVPIGLIGDSYGGSTIEAWMSSDDLKAFPEVKVPLPTDTIKEVSRTPTTLYNGMLHPVIGYGIKGAIWYQGESNVDKPDRYEDLFPAMVSNWRKAWGMGEFPFYYAQIAPNKYKPIVNNPKSNSAFLRDAQRKSLSKIPNSGMAVLMDIGDGNTIHPANKKDVGSRLAYQALAQTYDVKGFGFASPDYQSITIDKDKAVINFKNVPNGLTSFGKDLTLFEIAGEDKKFYPATAKITGSSVTVTSADVKAPVAVRYAFKDFLIGDLFGNDGLPVSSFRTDNWDY
ncbi:sialate O-acetylesterase [Pedobacter frigiditerrae]|uniref:Sialate O-acetylesterase n=1 Tax=Pedobacter frigiditerrae TaxID=2530452 RepID=A0A4R0MV20_9SPHI|nr:sialate O-acetylesterase [Pedobacter frigiditerrae]TCC90042.1 sialate O-acetylesterase [Pedobacter frigiditerrae]